MKNALANLSDKATERVLQFQQDLGARLQEKYGDGAEIVLLGHGVDLILPDGHKVELDLRDVDEDALVLEFAVKAEGAHSAEIVGVSCDEKGVDHLVYKTTQVEFLKGCDELDEIFDTDRGMDAMTHRRQLNIAHDRVLTADIKLEQALGALGRLAEEGGIDVELHDEVYDLQTCTHRIRRVLDKMRRREDGDGAAARLHKVDFRDTEIDAIEGMRGIVGDFNHVSVEYRFSERDDNVTIDTIDTVGCYNTETEAYVQMAIGGRRRLRTLKPFAAHLKDLARQVL